MSNINLIECIRSTWQGEGKDVGVRTTLCRFKKCQKQCIWCDTMVKMRISEESEYSIKQLQKVLDEENTSLMITGGEPTFSTNFDQTYAMLTTLKYPLANVESNGYRLIELILKVGRSKNINYMYSPKIFTIKELKKEKETSNLLKDYPNVYFKIVYEDNDLINDYLHWLDTLNINNKIYLMPEGTSKEDLIKNSGKVFDKCEEYKFNFSSREHIIYSFI